MREAAGHRSGHHPGAEASPDEGRSIRQDDGRNHPTGSPAGAGIIPESPRSAPPGLRTTRRRGDHPFLWGFIAAPPPDVPQARGSTSAHAPHGPEPWGEPASAGIHLDQRKRPQPQVKPARGRGRRKECPQRSRKMSIEADAAHVMAEIRTFRRRLDELAAMEQDSAPDPAVHRDGTPGTPGGSSAPARTCCRSSGRPSRAPTGPRA